MKKSLSVIAKVAKYIALTLIAVVLLATLALSANYIYGGIKYGERREAVINKLSTGTDGAYTFFGTFFTRTDNLIPNFKTGKWLDDLFYSYDMVVLKDGELFYNPDVCTPEFVELKEAYEYGVSYTSEEKEYFKELALKMNDYIIEEDLKGINVTVGFNKYMSAKEAKELVEAYSESEYADRIWLWDRNTVSDSDGTKKYCAVVLRIKDADALTALQNNENVYCVYSGNDGYFLGFKNKDGYKRNWEYVGGDGMRSYVVIETASNN